MIKLIMSKKTIDKEPEFFKTRSLFAIGIFYLLQVFSILSVVLSVFLCLPLLLFIIFLVKDGTNGALQTLPWYSSEMFTVIKLLIATVIIGVVAKMTGKYLVRKEIKSFADWSEKEHGILTDPLHMNETSYQTKTFYDEILENINVQNLLKCLSVDDNVTLRYVTRTVKVLSQFGLNADQEHVLMRSCEELSDLDKIVSNLIHVEQVEFNMSTILEILNIICDNIAQVEKTKTSELISLLHSKQSVIMERKNRNFFEEQSSEQLIKVSTSRIYDGDIDTLSLPW